MKSDEPFLSDVEVLPLFPLIEQTNYFNSFLPISFYFFDWKPSKDR